MAIDTSPTTQDALSLIVQNYNKNLDPVLHLDDVNYVFDAPTVNPDSTSTRNTRMYVRPVVTSGKYGRVTIYYDRIDLGALTDKPVITRGTAVNVADIIPLINSYYGINLVAADYVDGALPAQSGSTMDFTINTKSGSLMFIGGLTVSLKSGTPAGIAPAPQA